MGPVPFHAGQLLPSHMRGSAMPADSSMPILVVDDYQTMVHIIRNLLKQIGYENVDEASNGQAALEMIRAKPYGLVISDWNMEPMTGFELLQNVRSDSAHRDVPFIMVHGGVED
jgi:two-component system chemotaxis response regulator CheY